MSSLNAPGSQRSIWITDAVWLELRDLAHATNRSMAHIVRRAIRAKLKTRKPETPRNGR